MDATDWVVVEDKIYFCNATGIFRANTGTEDNQEPMAYIKQQAYNRFNGEKVKGIYRVKVRYSTLGSIEYATRIGTDFKLGNPNFLVTAATGTQSYWDESYWDVAFWSDENSVSSFKGSVFARKGEFISIGYFGSSSQGLEFYSSEILYEGGNGDI
jgi:hypothetical protein